jgi:hypothetical protein
VLKLTAIVPDILSVVLNTVYSVFQSETFNLGGQICSTYLLRAHGEKKLERFFYFFLQKFFLGEPDMWISDYHTCEVL